MSLHGDRPKNTIIGVVLLIVGTVGFPSDWLGWAGKILFGGILLLGILYTALLGFLPQMMIMLLALPFFLIGYALFLPIKRKHGKVLKERNPIVAYGMQPDRIVLVYHCFIPKHMNAIEGSSVFRGRRKLEKMKKILAEAAVPEVAVDDAALGDAVEVWNGDDRLRRKLENRMVTPLGRDEPLIVLDRDSKERVDRIHHVVEALWQADRYRKMRDELFQLAVWYSLAVDKCYGREEQDFFTREFV